MSSLNFKIIGIDDVTDIATSRFTCCDSDGESIFIGADDNANGADVWQYQNDSWKKITSNLKNENFRGVHSIVVKDSILYVGTGGNYLELGEGQVWSNDFTGWKNTGLSNISNFNVLIRKLLKVGNSIYAAGTGYSLFKLDGTTWTEPINTTNPNLFNWVDMDTDGSSVYASVIGTAFTVSGLIKYTTTGTTQVSLPNFGVSSNLAITKLCYSNQTLFAGTYNEFSGAQLWSMPASGSTWYKIEENGFGDYSNYMIDDIKVINNNIIISVLNTSGGKVYTNNVSSFQYLFSSAGGEFTPTSPWQEISTSSNTVYNGYLIQNIGNTVYLIGKQKRYLIETSKFQTYLTANQKGSKGLNVWPDNPMACLPIGNDRYRSIGLNLGNFCITEGPLNDIAETPISPYVEIPTNIQVDLSSNIGPISSIRQTDILNKKSSFFSGMLGPQVFPFPGTLNASSASGISLAGGGGLYKDESNGLLFHIYYTEEGYWGPTIAAARPFTYAARLAVSFDNGLSYFDCGFVLTPEILSSPSNSAASGVNGCNPNSLIRSGDYLYVYFEEALETTPPPGSTVNKQCLARVNYADLVVSAFSKTTPTWYKYHNGAFSQPGIGGSSTALNFASLVSARVSQVFYSDTLNKFVYLEPQSIVMIDSNLYLLSFLPKIKITYSDDGFSFGIPQILNIPSQQINLKYLSVLNPKNYIGQITNPIVIYSLDDNLTWSSTDVVKSSASLVSPSEKLRTFTTTIYSKSFDLTKTNDRGQLHPFVATLHYIQEQAKLLQASSYYDDNLDEYSQDSWWKNTLQSSANTATLSGAFPVAFSDYTTYKFGRDFQKLYYDYTHNFNRHRAIPTTTLLDGPTIFGHTFGSVLYNSKMTENGSLTQSRPEYITSSLSSTQELNPYSILFSTSGAASGCYIASSTADVLVYTESGSALPEFRNSGILSHVEFIHPSAASVDNSFSIIRLDKNNRASYNYNPILYENTLIKQKSVNSNSRFAFDIKKYSLNSSLGYDVSTNFLSPDHKFKLSLKALIASKNGLRTGGGSISVWIHTKPERGKIWTYTKDKVWIQHNLNEVKESTLVSTYCHTLGMEEIQRDLTNAACTNFLITDNLNRENDVIASVNESEFSNFDIEFDTDNKAVELPADYFDNVSQALHRLNQNYVIEIFSNNKDDSKFTLFYGINLIDLTLNKWSKPFVTGKSNGSPFDNYCKEYRVDLTREQLLTILKYFNEINGAYNQFGYASRVASYTSGVYEASGGSRINYVESPEWSTNTKSSGGSFINSITLNN